MEQTSKERQRPLRPPCHCDPSGPGRRAGPAEHHIAAPAAAQRPKGPRAPHCESATWRGEPRQGRSGCRIKELVGARCARSPRRPLDPKRLARAHEAREAEWRLRAGPAGPGAGAAGQAPRSPGGGVARSRSRDGQAGGPAQEGQPIEVPEGQTQYGYSSLLHPLAPGCCSIPRWASLQEAMLVAAAQYRRQAREKPPPRQIVASRARPLA